ncbi:MAG: hypothetical protein ACREQI_15750 [Candidatus Binataceae bacterium]
MGARVLLVATALVLASGCSLDMGTLTALATHNVNVPTQPIERGVEGSDCIYFVLGIPVTGSLVPNLQEAEDRALAKAPEGDAMANVALYLDPTWFLIGSSECYRVKGDVVKIAQQPSAGAKK